MKLGITSVIQRKADCIAIVRKNFQVELSEKWIWLPGKVESFSFLEILKQKLYSDLLWSLQKGILVTEKGQITQFLGFYKCLGLNEWSK